MARFAIFFGQRKAKFYLRPDADDSTDGWTDELNGTTDIYQSIDETIIDDANYVISPMVVGATTDLTVRLYEGATEIAEWTHSDIASTFITTTQILTTPEFEAIANFSDLFVELDDNAGNVYRFSLGDPAGGAAEPVKVKYRYKKVVN